MRSQLRLQVVLPVAVLGLLGVGFGAFVLNGSPETNPGAAENDPLHTTPTTPAAGEPPNSAPEPKPSPLERALRRNSVVVALFYAPGAAYDTIQTREARAGAAAAHAGFFAVDVSREGAVASLATQYQVRDAPAILVFTRGPQVVLRLSGYADRETVAQAAQNARA